MALADPRSSRAVLIGVDAYDHLDPLPGVRGGVRRLAELLRDRRVWGLPKGNVTVVRPGASAEDVLAAVREAGDMATDTLLVYFAGHGLRDSAGEQLYLALSRADDDHPEIGTLAYPTLRRVVAQAGYRARRRITVLDCCYSGLAIGMGRSDVAALLDRPRLAELLGEEQEPPPIKRPLSLAPSIGGTAPGSTVDGIPGVAAEEEEFYGSCVLTSASSTERSYTRPGHHPDFTAEILHILEHGIPGAGPTLSVDLVWRQIRARMARRERPQPQQFGQNTATAQPWVHNRAHVESTPAPAPPLLPVQDPASTAVPPTPSQASRPEGNALVRGVTKNTEDITGTGDERTVASSSADAEGDWDIAAAARPGYSKHAQLTPSPRFRAVRQQGPLYPHVIYKTVHLRNIGRRRKVAVGVHECHRSKCRRPVLHERLQKLASYQMRMAAGRVRQTAASAHSAVGQNVRAVIPRARHLIAQVAVIAWSIVVGSAFTEIRRGSASLLSVILSALVVLILLGCFQIKVRKVIHRGVTQESYDSLFFGTTTRRAVLYYVRTPTVVQVIGLVPSLLAPEYLGPLNTLGQELARSIGMA